MNDSEFYEIKCRRGFPVDGMSTYIRQEYENDCPHGLSKITCTLCPFCAGYKTLTQFGGIVLCKK